MPWIWDIKYRAIITYVQLKIIYNLINVFCKIKPISINIECNLRGEMSNDTVYIFG